MVFGVESVLVFYGGVKPFCFANWNSDFVPGFLVRRGGRTEKFGGGAQWVRVDGFGVLSVNRRGESWILFRKTVMKCARS